MAILDFLVSGWHVFGSVSQVCFGISVSNFMCMSFVAVGRSLTIVSYVAFKIAALWFWTMPPFLSGGGILVDHWSTISSLKFVTLTLSFLAATKQLYEWFSPSVCLSVCPSVCHTFLTMFPSSYHHEIFRSYYQWQKWRPCKRSWSEVKGQGHRGHNPT